MSTMKQWKSLTLQLKKIFEDLPSEKEREEVVGSINNLMKMLESLEKMQYKVEIDDETRERALNAIEKMVATLSK